MSLSFGSMIPQSQAAPMALGLLKSMRDMPLEQIRMMKVGATQFEQSDFADNGRLDGSAFSQFPSIPQTFLPAFNVISQLDAQDDGQLNGSVFANAWWNSNKDLAYKSAADLTRIQQALQHPEQNTPGLNFQNMMFSMVQGMASTVAGGFPSPQTQVTRQNLADTVNLLNQRKSVMSMIGPELDPQTQQKASQMLDAQRSTAMYMFNNFDRIAGADGDSRGMTLSDLGRTFNFAV